MFFWEQIVAFFRCVHIWFLSLVVGFANFTGLPLDAGGVHGLFGGYAYTFPRASRTA